MADLSTNDILQALLSGLKQYEFLSRVGAQYHVAVFPDDNRVRVEHYETLDALITGLRAHLASDSPPSVVPFIGAPMAITRPPNRQLRTPDGLIPLETPQYFSEDDDFSWSLDKAPAPPVPAPVTPGRDTVTLNESDIDDEELEELDDNDDEESYDGDAQDEDPTFS